MMGHSVFFFLSLRATHWDSSIFSYVSIIKCCGILMQTMILVCAFSSLQASWQKCHHLSHTLDNVIRKLFSKLVTWAIPGKKFLFKTCLQIYTLPVRFKKSMETGECCFICVLVSFKSLDDYYYFI